MADATRLSERHERILTAAAAVAAGEIWQLPDGRAAVHCGANAAAIADTVGFSTEGVFTVAKTTSMVILDGGPVYWDHSANKAHYKQVSDRDFFLGTAVGDAAAAATTMKVNLNVRPQYKIDLARDGFASVLVGTAAAGGFGYPVQLGGSLIFELTATNEAQKVDALSVDGLAVAANAIIEGAFRVISDGASGSQDVTIGVASGIHASDFQSVAEFVALHLDGNVTAINVQSDDGTTDVAPTDSTTTYTEGAAVAQRKEFWIDLRDPADAQVYIDGVLVLGSTVFTLAAATGPLFLVVHVEKASGTDVYKLAVDWLRTRTAEQ